MATNIEALWALLVLLPEGVEQKWSEFGNVKMEAKALNTFASVV